MYLLLCSRFFVHDFKKKDKKQQENGNNQWYYYYYLLIKATVCWGWWVNPNPVTPEWLEQDKTTKVLWRASVQYRW